VWRTTPHAKTESRRWYGGCDTPLNAIAPFNDAYEITLMRSIALRFLLKDGIFLFAIHVPASHVHGKQRKHQLSLVVLISSRKKFTR